MAREITYNNFEISVVVFIPNITTNHAITYTNNYYIKKSCLEIQNRAFSRVGAKSCNEIPASLRERAYHECHTEFRRVYEIRMSKLEILDWQSKNE